MSGRSARDRDGPGRGKRGGRGPAGEAVLSGGASAASSRACPRSRHSNGKAMADPAGGLRIEDVSDHPAVFQRDEHVYAVFARGKGWGPVEPLPELARARPLPGGGVAGPDEQITPWVYLEGFGVAVEGVDESADHWVISRVGGLVWRRRRRMLKEAVFQFGLVKVPAVRMRCPLRTIGSRKPAHRRRADMPGRVMSRPETYLITLYTHGVKGVEHGVCVAGRRVDDGFPMARVNASSGPGGALGVVYVSSFHIDTVGGIAKDRYRYERCSVRNVLAERMEGLESAVNVSGRRVHCQPGEL